MAYKLIFLGSPGAGKGTIAQKLAEHLQVPHISTGDIFRSNIKNRTPLGLQVESITASGALVPDELTIALVQDRLQQADAKQGYILDGFPRTIAQAKALDDLASIDIAVNFVVPQEVVIARLSGRLTCSNCGRGYHKIDFPPKTPDTCDICGHALMTRKDDTMEAIQHRLAVYEKETAPLIQYYQDKNILANLNSNQNLENVFTELLQTLKQANH
ncbi:adenylate kinase [Entomospira entomophila]|uniref:Adenylate kinase n=1 Tax=Entomospira entomophila TaxID=2719988 RepID=A0A968KW91_9SPIO|nr:adenylate kinase [Entomospira entomophilus]NIZ40590.1 adenylate kinase [Entomospira entomophilus]WDI34805.1 adenylate kinase [Entomospira entomophilus]